MHEPFPERPALLFDLVFPPRSEHLLLNLGIADAHGLTPIFAGLGTQKMRLRSRGIRACTRAELTVFRLLRHWRPSSWANRESSRTIVAECSACQTWIIVKRQFSIASARQLRAFCVTGNFVAENTHCRVRRAVRIFQGHITWDGGDLHFVHRCENPSKLSDSSGFHLWFAVN